MIFRGVRARLMGMLLCAAVPIAALAILIAYDRYQTVTRDADRWVWSKAHAVAENGAAIIRDARTSMNYLSLMIAPPGSAPLEPGGCALALSHLLGLSGAMFRGVALVDPQGRTICSVGSVGSGMQLGGASIAGWSKAGSPFVSNLLGAMWRPAEAADLHVATPVAPSGALLAVLIASIDVEMFARLPPAANSPTESFVWLVDDLDGSFALDASANEGESAGGIRDHARLGDVPAPPNDVLDALRAAGTTASGSRMTESSRGEPIDYAGAPLTSDIEIVAGSPLRTELGEGRALFIRQVVEVAGLLFVGLALVAMGADRTIAMPLKTMTRSVRRWRDGGAFAFPREGRLPPFEVEELANSFEQAISSLNERERQLGEAKAQQELLMQEIHHRVKNNLQIIASLLNLQASRIRQPEAKAEFQSARDRIRALATLHRHLYAHGEIHTINMRGFLTELCEQLLQAIGEKPDAAGGRRIRLHIDARELRISSDQAVPMALVVTEAVSNAAKYAFPNGRSGNISVTLTDDGGLIKLIIEDDGIGIPAGRAETETGIRDGIGLQLIRGFARQLGATLTVIEDRGTRYEIELKAHRLAAAEQDDAPAVHAAGETSSAA